ncbi:MAG: malectin domain-containing carbohydrate-binding protein [Eubacteriales bacterium]|nr:malectin domain-containing carbohydrate-binding protein [Eubacteriales bacterium]
MQPGGGVKPESTYEASQQQRGYQAEKAGTYQPGSGQIYYVDSEAGNDGNDGKTEAAAFKSLNKVNELALQPGDSILLKKGSIFDDQQLYPKGKGTPEEHILIGTYGESNNKPVINAGYQFREALLIENMEYVDVTGLELTNDDVFNETTEANDPNNRKNFIGKGGEYDQFRPLGIHISIDERKTDTLKKGTSTAINPDTGIVDEENRAYKGINIDGCYIHNVDGDENCNTNKLSGGIGVEVNYYNDTDKAYEGSGRHPYFDGVTLQNNVIEMVERCGIKGVRLTRLDGDEGEWGGNDGTRYSNVRNTKGYNQAALNYVVRNNKLSYIGGDGILIDSTKGALCENNLMDHHTWRATGANAGIWQWNAFDTVFQYNEAYAGPSFNQDGCSYDSDYWSGGTIYQYNYSHDTPMGFMLLMGNNDTDIVRYNLSQNDGLTWRHIVYDQRSASYVYNNVFYYDGANWRFIHDGNTDDNANLNIGKYFNYYNNIWYNTNEEKTSRWRIGNWENAVTENNIVYEASGIHDSKEIPGALHVDPKFVNPGGGETANWSSLSAYQLQEGSPAIGAGSYVDVVPQGTGDYAPQWNWQTGDYNTYQDFYGNALYQGAPDIGLEESRYEANPVNIEKNAVYKFYNRDTKSYLQRDGENVTIGTEEASSQDFMVVGSGENGYKIRIWDSGINSYLYLEAESGVLALKETSQTVWQLEDLKNGLVGIAVNGKSVTAAENKASLQTSGGEASQQWQLQLQEHSKSYNAGGKEIEGFSADQQFQETGKQSGYVGEPQVVGNTDADSVFASGLTDDTLEYKIYGSKGEYTLRLYFNELEGVSDRTFNILVNGKTMKEDYHLPSGDQIVELGGIYPSDGKISVKLTASYNGAGVLTNPVLCGISADRQPMTEVVSRLNAGGGAFDGLAADTAYTDKNGSGYYGSSQETAVSNTLPDPDAGMGTVLKTAREGESFGYKFKEAPGQYRVKLYFNEGSGQNHKFNVLINGQTVKENYSVTEAAKGSDKGTALVFETASKDGLVDISFQGIGGSKAMVNAVILEAYEPITDENLALKQGVTLESSSTAPESYKALENANDDDQATRWSTENGVSEASITVDLQTKYMLNHVMVDWTPGAYATSYHIEISEDGQEWKTAASISEANPGLNVTELDSVVARYVKIVGEKMNAEWGMSLTELGVYGTEVRGEMSASAEVTDKEEANLHELTVGAENIYKKFSTMKVRVIYDSSKFEFAGSQDAGSENQNTDALAFNKRSDVNLDDPENAFVEYVYSIKKKDAFQEPGNVLKTTMKTLTQAREYVKVEMRLTNAEGHETILPVVKAYMPAGVSYEALRELINECRELYDNAVVGIRPGEFDQKDKDSLKAAIDTADSYTSQSAPEELQQAFADLDGARESFLAAQKKAQFVSYHKDYRTDREANFTGGIAAIGNNALNLAVNAHSIAVDKDSPLLAEGHLYVRFKVDNTLDQTKFVIVDDQGEKRASIGFDAGSGKWFWDSASWADFGNAQPLQADKETELHLKYELNENNKYNLTLWINGVQIGATHKDIAYAAGTGRLAFEARNKAKNFQILETYLTDADPVTIQVSTEGSGTASQTGAVTSFKEADKTISFIPDSGEELESVVVDGTDVTEEVKNAGNSYTFTYLLDNHTVKAVFTGGSDKPDPGVQGLYHKDYRVDGTDKYSESTAALEEGHLNLKVLKTATTGNEVRAAVPEEAEAISQGVLHTRFRVNDIADQTIFDLKRAGDNDVIRIGYDYDPAASRAMWFYDKSLSGQGWGDIGNAVLLEADKTYDLKAEFKIKEDYGNGKALYVVTLTVNGTVIGTVEQDYLTTPGTFGWGARRADKVYSIDEVYYTSQSAHILTVSADETNGTVSETGTITTYHGADKSFLINPAEGYEADVTVNGTVMKVEQNGIFTLENIQEDKEITISFKEIPKAVTYHKDFAVDTAAAYSGNLLESQNVENGAAVLKMKAGGDNNFAIAMDTNAPELTGGTFYTRFSVENLDDQVLFDLMTDGTSDGSAAGYIRIGYETAGGGHWFYDKSSVGQGWGDFPDQPVKLEAGKEYELELGFDKDTDGTYSLTLTVNGLSCGTVSGLGYGPQGGKYAYASRRAANTISVKETYYTNRQKRTITVTSGENGTVSQTGAVTAFDGADKTLIFKPDAGYQVVSVMVNGQPVETADRYTFQNINEDAALEVTFGITEAGALREELAQQITIAKAVVNDNYTPESWDVLQSAISDAQALLDNGSMDQEALTQAMDAIINAVNGLVKNELDYRELKQLHDFGTEIIDAEQTQTLYTEESFNNYTAKKTRAAELLGEQTEPEDEDVAELQAENTVIEDTETPAEEEPVSEDTGEDWDASQEILMFTDGAETSAAEISEAAAVTEALEPAPADMFTSGDAFAPEEPVMPEDAFMAEDPQDSETVENEDAFIPEEIFSSEEEENVSEEEIMLQAGDVTQNMIDTALAELEEAIRGLKPAASDLTEVEQAIFNLKTEAYALKGKVKEKYSEERWNAFETAMTETEALVNRGADQVTSEEIQAVLGELMQTAEELPKPTSTEELKELYEANKDKTDIGYTRESWSEFQAALESAKGILENPAAVQEDIDAVLKRLGEAISGLVIYVPDPGPGPQPTPDPTPTPDPSPTPDPTPTPGPEPTPTPSPEDAFKAAVPEVTVKADTLYTVSINWKAIENAGSYRVYRKGTQAGAKYTALKTVGKNTTSYVDKTAKPGTTYYYAVRAFWDEGGKGIQSKASADKKVATPKLATPKAKAAVVNTNQVKVTWNKVEGATTYKVWRKETNSNQGYKAVGTIKASKAASFIDKKVKYGTQYTYHVRAYRTTKNYSVKSVYTDKMTAAVKVVLPAPKVTAQGKSRTSIQVKWNKLSGATGYAVYRKTGKNGSWSRIFTANSKTLTYVDKKAKKGTQYYYMVRGYKKVNGKNVYGIYSKGAAAKTK